MAIKFIESSTVAFSMGHTVASIMMFMRVEKKTRENSNNILIREQDLSPHLVQCNMQQNLPDSTSTAAHSAMNFMHF